ncbi:MAG: hypothetical protein ABI835_15195 [Chloroflexota bacterium]
MLRRLERWLHQHIFKVGWLLTKKSQTTTILYYTFFLPGVVLHEIIVWLMAGILNVRAERAFAWPEATAIAELRLNFIRLAKNTSRIKLAIISLAPLLVGLAVLWLISSSVLNLSLVIAVGRGGNWDDLVGAARLLLATPDVWLWVYLMFTIASTMFPNREALRGWRPVLVVLAVVIVALFVLGLAQPLLLDNLALPITEGLSRLALIFVVIIAIDLLVTGVLGTLEAIIERVTGHSATFQNGRLVALTKEDIQRLREQQRAKKERERLKQTTKAPRLPSGPPSFYRLPLPIPGAPGKEAAEPVRVSPAANPAFPSASPAASPLTGRAGPAMITGTAVVKTDDELKPDAPLQEAHIDLPAAYVKPAPKPAFANPFSDDEDQEDEDDQDEQPGSDVIDDMLAAIGGNQDDEDQDEAEEDRL